MTLSIKEFAVVCAAALVSAGAAQAADVQTSSVTSVNPTSLSVLSNGQSYTVLDQKGSVTINAHIYYDVGTAGRIHSWEAAPIVLTGYGQQKQLFGLQLFRVWKTYPVGGRPKTVDKTVAIQVPASALESTAVEMCNLRADKLRDQGRSDKQIFGQNQQVSFKVSVDFSVDASGSGSNNPIIESEQPNEYKTLSVVCRRWQGASVPAAGGLKAPAVKIIKATMKLQTVAALDGTCKVKLTTAINTSQAGAQIKYRYVHSSGAKSQIFTVKTAANKIAVVRQDWSIPNKPGPETGWMRMQGIDPVFHTDQIGYQMSCRESAKTGGFQAKPTKPTVGGTRLKSN